MPPPVRRLTYDPRLYAKTKRRRCRSAGRGPGRRGVSPRRTARKRPAVHPVFGPRVRSGRRFQDGVFAPVFEKFQKTVPAGQPHPLLRVRGRFRPRRGQFAALFAHEDVRHARRSAAAQLRAGPVRMRMPLRRRRSRAAPRGSVRARRPPLRLERRFPPPRARRRACAFQGLPPARRGQADRPHAAALPARRPRRLFLPRRARRAEPRRPVPSRPHGAAKSGSSHSLLSFPVRRAPCGELFSRTAAGKIAGRAFPAWNRRAARPRIQKKPPDGSGGLLLVLFSELL